MAGGYVYKTARSKEKKENCITDRQNHQTASAGGSDTPSTPPPPLPPVVKPILIQKQAEGRHHYISKVHHPPSLPSPRLGAFDIVMCCE